MAHAPDRTSPARLIALVAVALLGLTAGGAWFYRSEQQELLRLAETQFASIALLKADQIVKWRTDRLANVADLCESPFIGPALRRFLSDGDADLGRDLLRRFDAFAKHNDFDDILLVDNNGRPRLSLSGTQETLAAGEHELDEALLKRKPVFTDLHLEADRPSPHLAVVVPVFESAAPDAPSLGLIVMISDASQWLFPMIRKWPVAAETAETLLVRREGDDVLFLSPLRFKSDAAMKLRLPLSRTDNPAVMGALGRRGVVEGRDYRGGSVVAFIQSIPDSPWIMVAKEDTSEVFADWHRQALVLATLYAVLIGAAIGLGLFGWQREKGRYYRALYRAEADLRATLERHSITLHAIGDGVISTDLQGRVELLSPVAEALTGWKQAEALGRPLREVFSIVSELSRETIANPVEIVLREGNVVGLANHTLLLARDGREIPIADSAAPIRLADGSVGGVVLVFRDQTENRRIARLTQARLNLLEFAPGRSIEEILAKALDEAGLIVNSPIGFIRFLGDDEGAISLRCGSNLAVEKFRAEDDIRFLPLEPSGLWDDRIREGRPVIHNDGAAPRRDNGSSKELDEVAKFVAVPVVRQGKTVAVLGMGDKPSPYDEKDVESLVYLADVVWNIVELNQAEAESRRYSRVLASSLNEIYIFDAATYRFLEVNLGGRANTGFSIEEFRAMTPADLKPDFSLADLERQLEPLRLGARQMLEFEAVHWRKDGSNYPVEVHLEYFAEQPAVFVASARDISERKLSVAALRQSEAKFRVLFEQSGDYCMILDPSDPCGPRVIDANEAACRMHGFERSGMVGKYVRDLDAGMASDRTEEIGRRIERGETVIFETDHRRKDGTRFPVEVCAKLVRIGEDHPVVFTIERDITKRKQAEVELERFKAAVEQAGEAIVITDAKGRIQYVNPAFERSSGYARSEVDGQSPRVLKSGQHGAEFYQELWQTIAGGRIWRGRIVNRRKDGTLYTEETTISPMRDASGKIVNFVAAKLDISDQIKMEAQFIQAQKMESVGRLAGGVAHDFNNMLSVIMGHTELAAMKLDGDRDIRGDLQAISRAAEHSADLTRQLLAFARKQTISPRILDMNKTVKGMLKMLQRLIGEDIALTWIPGPRARPVNMDPAQVDQILANLCVNARDAILGVGKITIETDSVSFDEAYCADHPAYTPGDYTLLAVSDNGCGMDKATQAKIFEPFFTTKAVGRGTGLGLATVYGIVNQNGGVISVYSEPDRGTTFRVYLRSCQANSTAEETAAKRAVPAGRGESVLLVEDEPSILNMGKTMLLQLGYAVLEANSPNEALRLAAQHPGRIDLLITDVIMPGMNGRDLGDRLRESFPGLKIVFMSGYTADVIGNHGILEGDVNFVQKPFSLQALGAKVHEALNKA